MTTTHQGDTEIARHATRDGFGIAIIRLRGTGDYQVVRYMTPGARFVPLGTCPDEPAARQRANVEWLADMRP